MKKLMLLLTAVTVMTLSFAETPHTVTLNSGYDMPALGLGTWTLTGATCETAVYAALKSGYRLGSAPPALTEQRPR